MLYRLAIFDFDGTLVDTREAILAALMQAMDEAGLPRPEPAVVLPLVGLSLPIVLRRLAGPDADVAALRRGYRRAFAAVSPGRTRLYPGVRELVDFLAQRGVALAIATNRGRESAGELLVEHELRARFAEVRGGLCVENPKPHPEMLHRILDAVGIAPEAALMIGDTVYDIETGKAAGVATCAVTYGMHDAADLRAAEPTHFAADAGEIAGCWRAA